MIKIGYCGHVVFAFHRNNNQLHPVTRDFSGLYLNTISSHYRLIQSNSINVYNKLAKCQYCTYLKRIYVVKKVVFHTVTTTTKSTTTTAITTVTARVSYPKEQRHMQ